jgi:hypothetical protein
VSIRSIILTAAVFVGSPAASARAWELVQVGPHERSLEMRYGRGACETATVHNRQTRRTVGISVSYVREHLTGNEMCPAIAYVTTLKIQLSRPLAGRRVEGEEKIGLRGPYSPTRNGSSYRVVPRLTGLAPSDAKILLRGLRLHTAFRVVGRSTGLPRVVSQSPGAGVRDPKNRVVRVNVLG